jgi:hypothetical protein
MVIWCKYASAWITRTLHSGDWPIVCDDGAPYRNAAKAASAWRKDGPSPTSRRGFPVA